MNNKSQQSFYMLLQKFFLQKMIKQRNMSSQTIESYRDTFRIYLRYLKETQNLAPRNVEMKHLDRTFLNDFIIYLKEKRYNKPTTINNRLAAIRSFLAFVLEEAPEYSEVATRGIDIPSQKFIVPIMDFITKEEFEKLLSVCDTDSAIGARDKLMLLVLYNTGVRVTELISLKCSDLKEGTTQNSFSIKIMGKGRKERVLPLWKTTATYLKKYLNDFNLCGSEFIFKSKNGENFTRSGIRFRINKLINEAGKKSSTLTEKNISAHSFRHSVAMNLLTSGVDISSIAIWLGHESIETTHKYMVADMDMKRKALEAMKIPNGTTYNYKPSQDILKFLNSL